MGSTKNFLRSFHAIVAGDMSGNLTSPVSNIQGYDNVVIQLNFTGTPTGTFDVQTSVDYNQDSLGNVITVGSWISLPLVPAPAAAGAADQIMIDMTEIPAPWMRVVYTAASGVGTLDMYLGAKMI